MRQILQPVARAGLDYVMIAKYDTVRRKWPHLVKDVEKMVGYLHRQIDYQIENPHKKHHSVRSARKGGQT